MMTPFGRVERTPQELADALRSLADDVQDGAVTIDYTGTLGPVELAAMMRDPFGTAVETTLTLTVRRPVNLGVQIERPGVEDDE